jgi:hypothetical protein
MSHLVKKEPVTNRGGEGSYGTSTLSMCPNCHTKHIVGQSCPTFFPHPVKKEQHQCNFPNCRCILHPERLVCWSKALHKCNHPKKPVKKEQCECCGSTPYTEKMGWHCPHCPLSSPRPDGWDSKVALMKGIMKANISLLEDTTGTRLKETILNDIGLLIDRVRLSTRQEDARKFREMLDTEVQGTVMEHEGEKFVSTSTREQVAVNQALSNLMNALSTWESTI